MPQPATVLVPVFNAAQELDACLERLARYLPLGWQVQVVDDASTDTSVSVVLQRYEQEQPAWLIRRREHNLGFVAGCNEAMEYIAPEHDVLLLNTDTLPTPQAFLNMAMVLEECPGAATVTPWSNNAEICSLPELCRAAPVPKDPDLLAYRLLKQRPHAPVIPTAVGFCMLIRRAAIDALGQLFDADTFPRGYGEENDFCCRAVAAGWTNRLCDNAYVPHLGGASFGPLGLKPDADSMARLLSKHPGYERQIAQFIQQDPLASTRHSVEQLLGDLLHGSAH
jgi:GT2 family glycosyltransferase